MTPGRLDQLLLTGRGEDAATLREGKMPPPCEKVS
jgi:hypothetical protein